MIGARLKELRLKSKKTQADVAKHLGISQQAYNYYENDKRIPDYIMFQKLSSLYNVPISYILGEESAPSSETNSDCNYIIEGYSDLDADDKKRVDEYVALLKLKYKNEKK